MNDHTFRNDLTFRNFVLSSVAPVVGYGLYEMTYTSLDHAMYEVAAIAYLMGAGYDVQTAHRLVESWEFDEAFPPYQGQVTGYYQPHTI